MSSDYVYSSLADEIRVRIFKRASGRWDYDVFFRDGGVQTFSDEAGDDFRTKREAKADARRRFGLLRSINPDSVTEGW